jgi:hypothetical protein
MPRIATRSALAGALAVTRLLNKHYLRGFSISAGRSAGAAPVCPGSGSTLLRVGSRAAHFQNAICNFTATIRLRKKLQGVPVAVELTRNREGLRAVSSRRSNSSDVHRCPIDGNPLSASTRPSSIPNPPGPKFQSVIYSTALHCPANALSPSVTKQTLGHVTEAEG